MHEQDMAIVKSLVSVAWADGVFADAEKEMVESLIAAFEATDHEAKAIRKYASEKKTLDDIPLADLSADDRRVLVQHAVMLTFIDELCKRLRIPDDEAKELVASAEARSKRFLHLL